MFFVSAALAGSMLTASLVAPVPAIPDLDLLPEPGSWPCALSLQVDGLGAVTSVSVDDGCPSGLADATPELGRAWRWGSALNPHAEEVTVVYRVLGREEAEPKPESTPGRVVYLLRGFEVGVEDPPTWELQKLRTLRTPGSAVAAGVSAGACLVRLDIGPDGKVTRARSSRCADVLAPAALAMASKVRIALAEGVTPPSEYDLVVSFEAGK